ncbi:MAG: TIM barrel protein [Roseibium sp.]|nr:TIM barrel protein [Roseibium sp.]
MTIKIGNAPCSWGVEFANDPRNPTWQTVLDECREAGYRGIELGPVGFMPEDPGTLGDALSQRGLELIGGVVFQPFHDPAKWEDVRNAADRTCRALQAHGARHFVMIDSISDSRAATAGRPAEGEQMTPAEWSGFRARIEETAKKAAGDHGLVPSIHPHAGGFMDFEDEVERLLDEVDASHLKICLDTGHSLYAGFDPVAFMDRHMDRISYMHFKDIDPDIRADTIARRADFYDACGDGIFCNLGKGAVDFPAVKQRLDRAGYNGWCTVEQDCDPNKADSPLNDAKENRNYLASIGFEHAA